MRILFNLIKEMKLKDLKIGVQLNFVFLTIILLLGIFAVISWSQAKKLEKQSIDMYQHSLTVEESLNKLKSEVLIVQLELRSIDLAKENDQISRTSQDIAVSKANARKQFDVLYNQYVGSKADIDDVYESFAKWNAISDRTLWLIQNGKIAESMAISKKDGEGGLQVKHLFDKIQKIDDNSRSHAYNLYLNSINVHKHYNNQLIGWGIFIFLMLVILFFLMMKGVSVPLADICNAIKSFSEGKIDARNTYVSKNEFGILASSLNELADSLQESNEINEKAINLGQQMLSEEDAHRFCHSLLSALLADTWSQMGAVYLLNEEKTQYEYFECIGINVAGCKPFSATRFEGEFGNALATKRIHHLRDIPEDSHFTFSTVTGSFLPREIITIPIVSGDEVVSVISLATIKSYNKDSLKLLNMIQGTLNARMGGILANRKIIAFSQKLEYQNVELERQKNELSAQTNELVEQNIELEMQKKQLDESNKLKSTFLSNMSHELRTPLNSVIALSGVLNRRLAGKVPDEEYSYLEVIERNGKNLLLLINDILDLSRIESGREEVEVSSLNINDLIYELVEMLKPQAKNISLNYSFNDKLPNINSDYQKVRHILQNLLGNAVKFTEKGSVEVSAQAMNDKICITVIDTGIGIEKENLSLIFEEFRQADDSNSRRFGGTGLGLSIAQKYANLLGGDIKVESEYGKGSQFTLVLPLKWEDGKVLEESFQPLKNITPRFTEQVKCKDKTILVVEDTEAIVIQMKDILQTQGYNLMVARNGKEALELIDKQIPDGMILDLMMPGVDGFDVLKSLRADAKTSYLPVIILTAKFVTREELSFLNQNSIHQLIHKGDINKDQLLEAVAGMVCQETEYIEKSEPVRELPVSIRKTGNPVILVVEDNPDNMLTIKALLSGRGKIIEADDGNTGIEMAKKFQPNLILMDIALPGVNGIDALNEIREINGLKQIPIIAVSASAMKGDREKFLAQGFDGYVSKPIDERQFIQVVDEWVG